jgi:hypothetical protein
VEIKIKWIKRKHMTHENTYRDDIYLLFTQFPFIFAKLFLIRTAHVLPYDNAPSGVCTLMEEEEKHNKKIIINQK